MNKEVCIYTLNEWCCEDFDCGCDCCNCDECCGDGDFETVVDPGDLVYDEEIGEWMEAE